VLETIVIRPVVSRTLRAIAVKPSAHATENRFSDGVMSITRCTRDVTVGYCSSSNLPLANRSLGDMPSWPSKQHNSRRLISWLPHVAQEYAPTASPEHDRGA
jgi:hypothetical protein